MFIGFHHDEISAKDWRSHKTIANVSFHSIEGSERKSRCPLSPKVPAWPPFLTVETVPFLGHGDGCYNLLRYDLFPLERHS